MCSVAQGSVIREPPCSRGTDLFRDAASETPFFRNLQPYTALPNSTHMLSTLSNGLSGLAQAQLGRAALCAALPLLQRVASTAAAAGIHDAAAPSATAGAAGLHEAAAAAAAHQKHHKPAHKKKDFSIAPFLAKPGQGRRASVDAIEWNDRWGLNRAAASASLLRRDAPTARHAAALRHSMHAKFAVPAVLAPHGQPLTGGHHTSDSPPAGCAALTLRCRVARATPVTWPPPRPASRLPRRIPASATATTVGACRPPSTSSINFIAPCCCILCRCEAEMCFVRYEALGHTQVQLRSSPKHVLQQVVLCVPPAHQPQS